MRRALAVPVARASWLALALAPILLYLLLRSLGYLKLAKLGAVALVGAACASLLFLRPRWGLYFLLFYIYSGVGLFLPINVGAIALAIVLASVALGWVRGDDTAAPDSFFLGAVGLFLGVALISLISARDPMAGFRELFQFAKMLAVVAIVVHLIRTPNQLRMFCYIVFIGAVSTIALGILGITAGVEGAGEAYIGGVHIMSFTGAHENPNKAAAYMCSALPLGLFAVRHCANRWGRVAFTIGVVAMIVAIFATFSRSVVVALTVVLVAVAAYELRSRRSFIVTGVVLALGILLAPRYYWDRIMNLPEALSHSTQDWSVYLRMLALRTAWEMFLDHPLTGVGIGNFIASAGYRLFVRIVVHNTYLEVLVGTGIAGLFLYVTMMGAGVRHMVVGARRRWSASPEWMRSLSYYATLSAVSIAISAFFGTLTFNYPIWIPIAIGLVIGNLLREETTA